MEVGTLGCECSYMGKVFISRPIKYLEWPISNKRFLIPLAITEE